MSVFFGGNPFFFLFFFFWGGGEGGGIHTYICVCLFGGTHFSFRSFVSFLSLFFFGGGGVSGTRTYHAPIIILPDLCMEITCFLQDPAWWLNMPRTRIIFGVKLSTSTSSAGSSTAHGCLDAIIDSHKYAALCSESIVMTQAGSQEGAMIGHG